MKTYKCLFTMSSKIHENVVDLVIEVDVICPPTSYHYVRKLAFEQASTVDIPSTYEWVKRFEIISEEEQHDTRTY